MAAAGVEELPSRRLPSGAHGAHDAAAGRRNVQVAETGHAQLELGRPVAAKTAWVCASTTPGITTRPPASNTRVAGPTLTASPGHRRPQPTDAPVGDGGGSVVQDAQVGAAGRAGDEFAGMADQQVGRTTAPVPVAP